MPYKFVKFGKQYVQVCNKDNGSIKSKKTTIEKAKKQIKLLQLKDHLRNQNKFL